MSVAAALSELARWLRLEIINFRRKVQLWDVIGAAKKCSSSTEPFNGECQMESREEHMAAAIAREVEEEMCDLDDASNPKVFEAALPSQDVLSLVNDNQSFRLHQSDAEDDDDDQAQDAEDDDIPDFLTHQPEPERQQDQTDSIIDFGVDDWKFSRPKAHV